MPVSYASDSITLIHQFPCIYTSPFLFDFLKTLKKKREKKKEARREIDITTSAILSIYLFGLKKIPGRAGSVVGWVSTGLAAVSLPVGFWLINKMAIVPVLVSRCWTSMRSC